MERSAVYHISEHVYAYPVKSDVLAVRLKVKKDDVHCVRVHYKNIYDHQAKPQAKTMEKILSDAHCDYYESEIHVPEKRFKYYFELLFEEGQRFYTADGFLKDIGHFNAFFYPYINQDDLLDVPLWAKGETIYQIFVDRFANGETSNDPANKKSWGSRPDRRTYYGGDLQGVIEQLDYLKGLGVKILYLNPLFASPTYHKYDIEDYYTIEKIFGGEKALESLVEKAHQKDMKIILDGVFNHCSSNHPYFRDVLEKQEASPYKDWFMIDSFPVSKQERNYDSFGGLVPSMPKFDTTNPEVIGYLTDVAAYWTKTLNIDGWRLDVADEVSHTFWKTFRTKVKKAKSDLLIIGEVWNHASRWLQGDEMDTVTNYKFREWLNRFALQEISASTFWEKIQANMALYKKPLFPYLINLVGSHDTIRNKTLLNDEALHYLSFALMMMFEGMPLIYYGDEVGMEGGEDPDNRRAMRWELTDTVLAENIRQLCRFRARSEILKKGTLRPLSLDKRILGFERTYQNETLTVVFNFSEATYTFDAYEVQTIHFGEATLQNGLHIPPKQFAVVS